MPLAISVSRVDALNTADLELGHYYAASEIAGKKNLSGKTYVTTTPGAGEVAAAAGFYHAYLDANSVGHYQTAQLKAELAPYATYEVVIKAAASHTDESGQTWTNEQIADAIKSLAVDVDVFRQTGSRAMFYAGNTTSAATAKVLPAAAGTAGTEAEPYEAVDNLSLGGTKSVLQTSGAGIKCWFSLYIDGVNPSGETTADTEDVSGNFKITVRAHS